jgi:hypothetical protein
MAEQNAGSSNVKIFNFEKQGRRAHPVRRKAPENLLRRAGGLKWCMDLKLLLPNIYYKPSVSNMQIRPICVIVPALDGLFQNITGAHGPTGGRATVEM